MRTIGKVGVRAGLFVVLALILAAPAAGAQVLPPTGIPPVDDVIDQVTGQLPAPPAPSPTVPELPSPSPGTPPPSLPAPPSGVPGLPSGDAPAVPGAPSPGDAPDLGGLPAPGGAPALPIPDFSELPDFGELPDLCGLGSGVPDADVVDCILVAILGPAGAGLLDPPAAVCDVLGTLGNPLPVGCPEGPGSPPRGNPGGGGGGGGGTPTGYDVASDQGGSVEGATLARTGGSIGAGLVGLLLVGGGVLVLRARRFVIPI